jgi:hypothetical protein
MNKEQFIDLLNSESKEQGWWIHHIEDSWDLYEEARDNPDTYPPEILQSLIEMDRQDRLVWREELAEKGYEMTPMQVDQYIFIIQTVLEIDRWME